MSETPVFHRNFISGGGEMGHLIRQFDWTKTPLGAPETWPQSIKTAVGILLNSGYPMYIAWGDACIQIYNDAYRPILGDSKHPAALGGSTEDTFAEIWDIIGPMFRAVLQEARTSTFVDQLLPLNRYGFVEECYFLFSYSPVLAENGEAGGVFVTVLETSDRVLRERRQQALKNLSAVHTQAEHLQIFQSACDLIAADGHDAPFAAILFPGADKAWGVGAVKGPETLATAQIVDAVIRAGGLMAKTVPVLLSNEIVCDPWPEPVRMVTCRPITPAGHVEPIGILVCGLSPRLRLDENYASFFDACALNISSLITDAEAFEFERNRAEALAQIDHAKTAFFSNVSHEFRTPLTLLLAPLEEVLDDQSLPAESRGRLDLAHQNALRLLKLVNMLLDFSRIEAGRAQASFAPINLAHFTAELASNFQSLMAKAGLTYKIKVTPQTEPVYVDPELWEKIVLNLISNAFKYTLSGEVEVKLHSRDTCVELSVRDTGPGIAEAELPHIFQRFHRVEGVTARTIEGSGIGLALVRELVKLHGGEVTVESTQGVGSIFKVRLPTGRAHLPEEQVIDSFADNRGPNITRADTYVAEALRWLPTQADPEPSVSSMTEEHKAVPSGGRILLSDDNADMRDYMLRLLGSDYRVELVADGEAAWEAVKANPPDLVLSDVMMPQLDGFGLLHRIRSHPSTREIPVIMVSARAGEDARVEALLAGVDDYIVKPFSARELLVRVRSQLQMATLRREGEGKVRKVLDSIRDSLIVMDGEWRLTYVNSAAREMLASQGLNANALLGVSHWDAFPGSAGTDLERNYQKAMTERCVMEFENYYAPWDRWYSIRAYPIEDGGISVYSTDITERKLARNALVESEERWRGLTEGMPNHVWVAAADGRFEWFNDQVYSYSGKAQGELNEEQWLSMLHAEDVDDAVRAWSAARASGTPFEAQFRLRRADGRFRWHISRALPLRDASGSITRWIGTNTDVEDQRAALAALAEMTESLQQQVQKQLAERDRLWALSQDPFLITDFEGRWLRMSPAWAQLLGWSEDELLGKDAHWLDHPDDTDRNRREVAAIANGRTSLKFESRMRTKDGGYRTLSWNSVPEDGLIYCTARDVTDERARDQALRDSQEFARLALSAVNGVGVYVYDIKADLYYFDEAIAALYAVDPADGIKGLPRAQFSANIHEDDWAAIRAALNTGLEQKAETEVEHRVRRPDGSIIWVMARGYTQFVDGVAVRRTGIGVDITQKRRLEDQLRQAQKMEAVGQLTGGIAHDFNNMLAVVLGSLELLNRRLNGGDTRSLHFVTSASDAARRAANLTQRLLAFSRQQPLKPEIVDPNQLVLGISDLLRHSIGADIHLDTALSEGLWRTRADPNQLENVILNLSVNARDAMPGGGKLTIETRNVDLDAQYAAGEMDVQPGSYVMIAVTDTGAGMTSEIIGKAFDPFFTTKELGKGTGLGLSQVYGFVRQSGGHIKIYSEVGVGTSIKVYLPRVDDEAPDSEAQGDPTSATLRHAKEVVLVVDDEDVVRQFSIDAMTELGYSVVSAASGAEALDALSANPEIALLFTDIVMPEMNGQILSEKAKALRPGIKILYTTGYTRDAMIRNGLLDRTVHLIGKPFTLDELATSIRQVLDGS